MKMFVLFNNKNRQRISFLLLITIIILIITFCNAQLTNDEKQLLLKDHNRYRSVIALGQQFTRYPKAADMVLMDWNEQCVSKAQIHADNCKLAHDTAEDRAFPPLTHIGQNVYTYSKPGCDKSEGMKMFFDEHVDYTFSTMQCLVTKACAHFTQIIWSKTSSVGCAAGDCNRGGAEWKCTLVCNYAEGGNYVGNLAYTVGEPCTKCPVNYTKCSDGLCARPDQCERNNLNCSDSQTTSNVIYYSIPTNTAENVIKFSNNWNAKLKLFSLFISTTTMYFVMIYVSKFIEE